MVHDEGGGDAVNLEELADELVQQAGSGPGCAAVNLVLDAQLVKELAGF